MFLAVGSLRLFYYYRCFNTFLECKVHESDEQTVYKCVQCEETFSAQTELTEHEAEHKENTEEKEGGIDG